MTPREAIYEFVRGSLIDTVEDFDMDDVDEVLRPDVEEAVRWGKEEKPAFHDKWAAQHTDELIAHLDKRGFMVVPK